ncbi:MAG: hypothetical protein R2787_17030 [Saprospiraceae bacterium]
MTRPLSACPRRDSIISPVIHAYPVFRPWDLRLVPDDQLRRGMPSTRWTNCQASQRWPD